MNVYTIKSLKCISLLLCFTLMSCTTLSSKTANYVAPNSENLPQSNQILLNASAHWKTIAEDLAKQLNLKLERNNIRDRSVYINPMSEKTDFTEAFNDFLITHLVNKGILVSRDKRSSTIYNYKIQPIFYRSARLTSKGFNANTTTLNNDLSVDRDLAVNSLGEKIVHQSQINSKTPLMEILITSSILSHDLYLYRTSDIYYTNQSDMHLYQRSKQSHLDDAHNKQYSGANVFNDPFYKRK